MNPWIRSLQRSRKSTVDHRTFSSRLVNPNLLVQRLSEKMEADAVYVADVGQNQLWSADNYVMKTDGSLPQAAWVHGLLHPAAIGAKMCRPEAQVVAVCGDGSFQMSMYELGTIAVNRLPLKILVVQNDFWGWCGSSQEKTYDGHYFGVQLYDYPRYDKIAEAYDMEYFPVTATKIWTRSWTGF